jgi:hypothetical protein
MVRAYVLLHLCCYIYVVICHISVMLMNSTSSTSRLARSLGGIVR